MEKVDKEAPGPTAATRFRLGSLHFVMPPEITSNPVAVGAQVQRDGQVV